MQIYEFSIIASGLDPRAEDFESRFYEAGCDDATVSFQKGHIILDFAREAESAESAVASAIENVAETGARIDGVEPDPLVTLADIAARAQMSRAAISQYSKGQRGKGFPAPVAKVTSESPLWDWPSVARWLFKNRKMERDKAVEAQVLKSANDAVRSGMQPTLQELHRRASEYRETL